MTNSYSTSYQVGNIKAGNYDLIGMPGTQRRPTTRYPAVLIHGSGGTAASFAYALNYGSNALAANLALTGGIPWMASDNDLQAWGNDAAMADIDTQIGYLSSHLGTPAGKAVLVGGSMGGLTALRYAILNPRKVGAVIGIIPLTDLKYFYNANQYGTAAEIATAWGVAAPRTFTDLVTNSTTTVTSATAAFTPADNGTVLSSWLNIPTGTTMTYVNATTATLSAAAWTTATGLTGSVLANLPPSADIMASAGNLTVPTKLYYSNTDGIVFPARQVAFAAAANHGAGVPLLMVGPNGHSEQTIYDAQQYNGTHASDMITFLQTNGA